MMDFYITLDYELYNGLKSGTVQNCLITPTRELLKVLDKYQIKAVFFVDACFLLRLRAEKNKHHELEQDWSAIVEQIKYLSDSGHDMELHIHPNWYRAKYQDGNWMSIMDDYKLSDLQEEEAESLFRDGIALLQEITGKVVASFRAGAYCIQTYRNYPDVFKKYGIKIDSSVNRNKYAKTEKWEWFDYRSIPDKYKYSFSDDVCFADDNGSYTEYSIPNYRFSVFSVLKLKRHLKKMQLSNKPWGDGSFSVAGALYKGMRKRVAQIMARLKPISMPATIDGANSYHLNTIFEIEKRRGEYMLVMGHPKCLTPYSLSTLDTFLKEHQEELQNKTFIQS